MLQTNWDFKNPPRDVILNLIDELQLRMASDCIDQVSICIAKYRRNGNHDFTVRETITTKSVGEFSDDTKRKFAFVTGSQGNLHNENVLFIDAGSTDPLLDAHKYKLETDFAELITQRFLE
jgi:hypothetical protein